MSTPPGFGPSLDPSTTAISAKTISKRFNKETWALQNVSLDIPAESITGLIGPNGAGKTTLLRIFMGFERPTSGRVDVLDEDPVRRSTISSVGYVPQAPALYRDLSIRDHLTVASHYRPHFDRSAVEARLETLGIPTSVRVGSLSGGQTAQTALAIAFGLGARVLLLDEPLANLDPLARAEALTLLTDMTSESEATVVISSHLIEDIAQVCDRLVVIGAGHILLHDSIEVALAVHSVSDDAPDDGAEKVAELTIGGPRRTLWRHTTAQERPAPLPDVVLGYLALGRTIKAPGER